MTTSAQYCGLVLLQPGYWLAITIACLALAHLCYKHPVGKRATLTPLLALLLLALVAAIGSGILFVQASK